MALTRLSVLSRILPRHAIRPSYCQRRWAQVQDVRFLATQQAQSRILDKYRDKLDRKAKNEGHETISDLKEAYKSEIEELRKQAAVPGATAPLHPQEPPGPNSASPVSSTESSYGPSSPESAPPTSPKPSSAFPKPNSSVKPLSAYLDLDKISTLPTSQIEPLWRLRHANSEQSLSFSVPIDTWKAIVAMARKHPQFVLPLPREVPAEASDVHGSKDASASSNTAAEIHFMQWNFPSEHAVTVMFTHLAEYKVRGEYANAHTTVTFHTELAHTKGLVLGQGQVMKGRGVSVDEGKWLLMCMQKFYGVQAEQRAQRTELLESFTRGDSEFQLQTLLDEAERI